MEAINKPYIELGKELTIKRLAAKIKEEITMGYVLTGETRETEHSFILYLKKNSESEK